ncbi:MAG: T9SS type A sorting domain-containing protein [Bacteroidetes bacterium]|nr:T9SS type A sorting domain-containing protein [Bacteroidota bacterium]
MQKICYMKGVGIACLLLFLISPSYAQLLRWSPVFPKESSLPVTITCDASAGNKGLLGYNPVSDVYVHIGVITSLSTSSSDWKYVVNTNFNVPAASVQASSLGNDRWSFTINGGLRSFFAITNASERILKIAILFRNGNGSKVQRNTDGSDMYVPVYDDGLYTRIDSPLQQPLFRPVPQTFAAAVGDHLPVKAVSSKPADCRIVFNGNVVGVAAAASSVSADLVINTTGSQTVIAEADDGVSIARDTLRFLVNENVKIAALPADVKDGINYEPGDSSVILVLFAPHKKRVAVLGDFTNWTESLSSQMNMTPDSSRFWLRIGGLVPGTEYAYQYLVDGTVRIADYYAEKILDPANDPYIPASTYPGLKAYPSGKTTGIVSVLQTAKPAYNWAVNNFKRPDKKNLVIYELLLRDFIGTHDFKTLKDTLNYLVNLGVNAIELMPFSEFEGNLSWGYNPNFFFAPDKYYGNENSIRQFVDACHQKGIAVIMDLVMNHCMSSSPMAQLYWDAANNRPAADNPWLNPVATHPYNVGNDFNHESEATKKLVADVVRHWLTKYQLDGFRWDLSKGFTQVNNPADVNAWSSYDASRIATWKRIYDTMQQVSPNAYCILEHFAANTEEKELADYGMLLWGNQNYAFNQATMGYNSGSDFSSGISKSRGWSNPALITYQESHDEERLMYKNLSYGNNAGNYTVKDSATALKRNEMAAAFWAMIPGPKMLWQFEELGYPYSINTCGTGTVDPGGGCRTEAKPIHWEYLNQPARKALFDVYAKLIRLKLTLGFAGTFTGNAVSWDLSGYVKWLQLKGDSLQLIVIGNFDVNPQTAAVSFPSAGTWYSYLGSAIKTVDAGPQTISLQPGEYYVYTSRNLNHAVVTAVNTVVNDPVVFPVSIMPNPVIGSAQVLYRLPEAADVTVGILDMSGKNLGTVFKGFRPAGKRTLTLQGAFLAEKMQANGIYLLRIQYNRKTRVEKFMLIR